VAESYIQPPPNSTGSKIRTVAVVIGADTVHQQVAVLSASDGTLFSGDALGLDVDVSDNAARVLGHVQVDNLPATQPVSGPLTDAQLRASVVPVSGSFYQALQPISGSPDKRFAEGKTTRAGSISTVGDNSIITPAAGKLLRVFWVGLSSSQDNTGETAVTVKFGSTSHYRWNMGNPGAFSHWQNFQGIVDQPLVINLSAAQTVLWNATYEEV